MSGASRTGYGERLRGFYPCSMEREEPYCESHEYRRQSPKKNNLTGWAFVLLAVVGIVAFYFYPMIQALLLSFKSGVGANLEFSGLSNYKRLLVDTTFRTALSNTFIYLIIQVPVMIILGLFISVLLNDSTLKFPELLPYSDFLALCNFICSVLGCIQIFVRTRWNG